MADGAKETWGSGDAYERYVGRWSRRVARKFLAWLNLGPGLAWGQGWPSPSRLVLSADADLDRKPGIDGDRQDVAGGVETWWLGQRFGVRGGVRASTVGEARPVVAGGFSAAIRQGIYVDGHVSRGGQDRQAWSVSARVSF